MNKKVYTWKKIKQLIALPERVTGVYVQDDGSIVRATMAYTALVEEIDYRAPELDTRPTREQIVSEQNRAVILEFSGDGYGEYGYLTSCTEDDNFLGFEYGGAERDWSEEIKSYQAKQEQKKARAEAWARMIESIVSTTLFESNLPALRHLAHAHLSDYVSKGGEWRVTVFCDLQTQKACREFQSALDAAAQQHTKTAKNIKLVFGAS
jgi:hypothetical protein